jgi:hypothetical protein
VSLTTSANARRRAGIRYSIKADPERLLDTLHVQVAYPPGSDDARESFE